jgi:omega-amidase
MQDLKITIIQTNLIWENSEANLTALDQKIDAIKEETDLIVLPEMFSTGFSMNPERCAEITGGTAFQWMRRKAGSCKCTITGSILTKDRDLYYNRLFWMKPDGSYQVYDKRHLFRFAGEHKFFEAGNKKLITTLQGWKICPLICYDLRFPVWSKNRFDNDVYEYDLLIYVANWPERRSRPWKSLLIARSIENMAYAIGVNRIGKDGNNIDYSGDSMVLDFKGNFLHEAHPNTECIKTITLSYEELKSFRAHFKVGLDWDSFNIFPE